MPRQPTIYFAVTREHAENWDATAPLRQQARWDEHAAFMDALVDDGFVILGGPLGDGDRVLLIINAANEQDITDRLADDPWTPMGLLRTIEVERWEILLDARYPISHPPLISPHGPLPVGEG